MNEPIGDVWKFTTTEQDYYSDILSCCIESAMAGDGATKECLISILEEPWETIVSRSQDEGSTWVVWWEDCVNKYMKFILRNKF